MKKGIGILAAIIGGVIFFGMLRCKQGNPTTSTTPNSQGKADVRIDSISQFLRKQGMPETQLKNVMKTIKAMNSSDIDLLYKYVKHIENPTAESATILNDTRIIELMQKIQ